MAPEVSAIILAAGKSRRMGQPKMLLRWGDTTVLGQVVKVFSGVGLRDILVVTGGDRAAVEAEIEGLAREYPVRQEYREGRPR